MVRVRRRRRRRRGTIVLLLHAPSPLLRGGNPLHQHRIFLLPSLLLLLMLFLLVEASHARPAPPVPRPAPRQPPVPRPPQWTVTMGSERPTEGFDPGEEHENEVMPPIGTDLPWERTQPSASSELHQEGPRGEAAAEGVSGGASNSVIEDGNDTLPVPLYGIMTDEISSDVDLMLGGDGEGVGVTSEELVMWRLTNHDRRKGELETDEELLSRNRRTPKEKKGGRAGKKRKEVEEEKARERQRRRKGTRRPRWRERRRKAKEERENRGRGRERGRNKKGKESNPRPQRKRHQGHQFSTRERFLQITESVAAKKSRGGAVPKKPPVSRPRAKSPRIRGPGSMPRDIISSGEGGVSPGSGNLEDGAARSERSANLSHITGTARKIQMVVKNRNLQIDPWGRVSGAEDEDSDYTILQRTSVSTGRLKIQGVATCLFLCMDRCGLLYGSKNFTEECVWNETMDGHVYNVYTSVAYSNEDRALYLALNGAGKPRRVQIQRKDGKGLVLGKLSTYARVLTRTIQPNRLQRLEDKLLRDRQLEAVAQAVIAAGGTIPGYSNLTAGSLRHRIGPQKPTQIAKTNTGVSPSANRSSDLTSILASLGLDPSIINPDFNLDSVTFADHPLRHHGYHQLCPMPRPDMVTSGSELVGKNGKVLCKKKDPPSGKGKTGKGPGEGSGEKKKKKKDEDQDGKMRRKRKNQAKDVEEKKKKSNGGRNKGKGVGSGGGGRERGTKVKKVGEKRVTKGRGNKKGVERKAEMNVSKNEGRRGRNEELQKKRKNQAAKERQKKREQERRRRLRKRPCDVGRRPRKDKECDKQQKKRKRNRRGKDEMHQEQVLHNNTLEQKNEVQEEEEEEEVTESPLEWEEEEERVSEEDEVEGEEEESTEGNEDDDGEDGVDEEEEEASQEEEDEEEGDEDEEEDDGEDDEEGDVEEEEDGGENDGRGINVRMKRTRDEDSESS